MSEAVLDASALLAALNEEPGAAVVEEALPGAVIGTVNLSEVLAKLIDAGMPEAAAWAAVSELPLAVVDFDRELARMAGGLRRATRRAGLSLGDRACLALARRLGLPVLTADSAWLRIDAGVEVRVIR